MSLDRAAPMAYSEFEPTPKLKPWVAAYWHFRVEASAGAIEHRIPPTGGTTLVFPPGAPAVLVGPRISPLETVVYGGERFWGVHFWPGTGDSLIGSVVTRLREQQGLFSDLVETDWTPPVGARLATTEVERDAARVLDEALLARIPRAGPLDDKVLTAVFRILAADGRLRIGAIAERLDLSPRQLRRRFRRATGLTLKELARIQRIRASAVSVVATGERWVDLAADRGFSDQAHLVREFREILGLTPEALSDHLEQIEHGRLIR